MHSNRVLSGGNRYVENCYGNSPLAPEYRGLLSLPQRNVVGGGGMVLRWCTEHVSKLRSLPGVTLHWKAFAQVLLISAFPRHNKPKLGVCKIRADFDTNETFGSVIIHVCTVSIYCAERQMGSSPYSA
jgi:hypothetical protein